jgi:excisionase family DNA binding protein
LLVCLTGFHIRRTEKDMRGFFNNLVPSRRQVRQTKTLKGSTMPEENSALMTVDEAAAYLRLASWTLRHWVCQKKIPYVRLGRSVRFRRKDMERFVTQNLHGKPDERNPVGPAPERKIAATAN